MATGIVSVAAHLRCGVRGRRHAAGLVAARGGRLLLLPIALRVMWRNRSTGLRDRARGGWELAGVATSGLAIVAAAGDHIHAIGWAAVFPLGMYSSATFATAVETGWRPLTTISLVFFWIALAAWLLTALVTSLRFRRENLR
jgi:hypothetical protein